MDYHFVTREEFDALVDREAFVEHAEYGGNLYGTSWSSLDGPLGRGRDLLLEIEVQGAGQIRARRSDARLVFLLPPSLEELTRRLRGRGTDDEAAVQRRLEIVAGELRAVHVTDDGLEEAVEELGARWIPLGPRALLVWRPAPEQTGSYIFTFTARTRAGLNTRRSLRRLCRASGLELERLEYLGQYPSYFLFDPVLFTLADQFSEVSPPPCCCGPWVIEIP